MGLLDAAQAASNAAASTVSGPVDMLAWLLRKAGVNVGEPVGGSDWMKRKGLTKDVAPGASQVVGETLGLLAPTVAAAKAPQIAKGLLAAADNLAAPRTLNPQQGAIVWHGSPHKFDRFDSSKIGTGEGSQAFGHGLYLAEKPEVSRQYAAIAAKPGLKQGSAIGNDMGVLDGLIRLNANKYTGGDVAALADLIKKRPAAFAKPDDMLARIPEYVNNAPPGYLYKVDLPDNAIARMLDWDKPLSQQAPAVRSAIQRTRSMLPPNAMDDLGGDLSLLYGRDVGADSFLGTMNSLQKNLGETLLRRAGVPGVRYLDGGSRGAGAGTSNFVVFPGEEGLLTILERNGVPLR